MNAILNLLLILPQDAAAETDGGGMFNSLLIPMILVIGIFYFVMIGPERKQRKKRDEMLATMKKGDRVMTTSGMYGSVVTVQGDVVTLQIADGVRVRFSRQSIQGVLGKDSEKADKEKEAVAAK